MAGQSPLVKVLLVHPGTQHSHKLARELSKRKYLMFFYTGFSVVYRSFAHRFLSILPLAIRKRFSQRIIDGIRPTELRILPWHEVRALQKVKKKYLNNDIFFQRNEAFQNAIPDGVIKKADALIGFDTASWILAERADHFGKFFFLDVSTSHASAKQKVFESIREKYPDWQSRGDTKDAKYLAIEENEYVAADAIIVASTYSKATLVDNGVDANKIFINPYGVDLGKFSVKRRMRSPDQCIRFLFVGLVEAQKGLPVLLKVWERLRTENIELNIVGPVSAPVLELIQRYQIRSVNVIGKVSHNDLPAIFQDNDVFVFPSFFEGFGLVILEAMASGLPVITTTATAGPDIIKNEAEGFVIEPGDAYALERAISFFNNNRNEIIVMGDKARVKAEKFTWKAYGDRWKSIIDHVMESGR